MASSPSSMSGRRNRPGCMSGIAHLFDFNQALAGKKMLTDKDYGIGLEPQRKISDGDVEQFMPKAGSRGETESGKTAAVSGRSIDVSIKALMANDISEDLGRANEPKSRAPSLVARLMGLDELPCDRVGQNSRQTGNLENSVQEVHSDRLQHGKLPSFSSSRVSKNGGLPTRSVSDLSSRRKPSWEEHTPSFESSSTGSHLLKKEAVPDQWTDWRSEKRVTMPNLDDLDVQLAVKQMLIKKKLREAKLGSLAKNNGPQEKLYESREFMDAMDFLQANKDFFARFLEEPDSLFAKHLGSSDGKSGLQKAGELSQHSKRFAGGAPEHGITAQSKDMPFLRRSSCKEYGKIGQINERVASDDHFQREKFLKSQQRHAQSSKQLVSDEEECQFSPTRIVVLKPGPGKVQNLRSLAQSCPRSQKEFLDAIEIVKESSRHVLQELRCKLQQEDARDLRKAWTSGSGHSNVVTDPKEIAREIARQARENVMKDINANVKGGIINETSWSRSKMPSEVLIVKSGEIHMNDKESSTVQLRDPISETNFSSHFLDRKASPNRGRRCPEQIFLDKYVTQSSGHHRAASRRHPRPADCGCGQKQIGQSVESQKFQEVNSFYASKIYAASEKDMYCNSDSHTQSVCESDADSFRRNEDLAGTTLLRSKSVPTSYSYHEKLESRKGTMQGDTLLACDSNILDVKRPFDVTTYQRGRFRRSVFRRKRLASNGASSKRNAFVKCAEKTCIPTEELPSQNIKQTESTQHEKVQHQIDDSGPAHDSDSSVSSLDDFVTLEAVLKTDGPTSEKHPGKAICTLTTEGNLLPSKTNSLNPEESPSKSLSSTNVKHISANSDVSEGLLEQPSPVSVLDALFHEEPASPMDTESSSGVQDLGVHIQLLKFGDQESEAVLIQEECQEEDGESTDDQFSTNFLHTTSNNSEDIGVLVDGIMCPKGKLQELMYVQKLLIASGLTVDSVMVLTPWHLPSQPLATCVFELVESSHRCESHVKRTEECGLSLETRHLLFDSVNEILLQILVPYVYCGTWWKCQPVPSNMPLGEDLVRKVWSEMCKLLCFHAEDHDTLGSLVAEDLTTKDQWQDLSLDLETVMLGVETSIWNDMLEETLSSTSFCIKK